PLPEQLVGAELLRRAGRPGVAVARRLPDVLLADRAGGARLVDDDDLLAELLLQHPGGDPGDLVGGAAGAPGHDDGDRLLRLPRIVGGGGGRDGQPQGGHGGRDDAYHWVTP